MTHPEINLAINLSWVSLFKRQNWTLINAENAYLYFFISVNQRFSASKIKFGVIMF